MGLNSADDVTAETGCAQTSAAPVESTDLVPNPAETNSADTNEAENTADGSESPVNSAKTTIEDAENPDPGAENTDPKQMKNTSKKPALPRKDRRSQAAKLTSVRKETAQQSSEKTSTTKANTEKISSAKTNTPQVGAAKLSGRAKNKARTQKTFKWTELLGPVVVASLFLAGTVTLGTLANVHWDNGQSNANENNITVGENSSAAGAGADSNTSNKGTATNLKKIAADSWVLSKELQSSADRLSKEVASDQSVCAAGVAPSSDLVLTDACKGAIAAAQKIADATLTGLKLFASNTDVSAGSESSGTAASAQDLKGLADVSARLSNNLLALALKADDNNRAALNALGLGAYSLSQVSLRLSNKGGIDTQKVVKGDVYAGLPMVSDAPTLKALPEQTLNYLEAAASALKAAGAKGAGAHNCFMRALALQMLVNNALSSGASDARAASYALPRLTSGSDKGRLTDAPALLVWAQEATVNALALAATSAPSLQSAKLWQQAAKENLLILAQMSNRTLMHPGLGALPQ